MITLASCLDTLSNYDTDQERVSHCAERAGSDGRARGRWKGVPDQSRPGGACPIHPPWHAAGPRQLSGCGVMSASGSRPKSQPMGWRYERSLLPVDARALHYSCAPALSRRHGHSPGARFGIRVLRYRRRRTAAMPYEPSFPRQDMRYDGRFDMLARNDEPPARDNGWVGKPPAR